MNKGLLLAFLIFTFEGILTNAFSQDSTKYIKANTRNISEFDIDHNKEYSFIDTSFNRLEIFQPVFKKYIVFQDLGNVGSSARPLLFNVDRTIGFEYLINPFDIYFLHPSNTHYIKTKTPYTDIFYAQGRNEVLFLTLKHAQNILPRWNVGIDYQRITSEGFLLRQYTSHYNIQLFTSFQSKNKRYTLLASTTWNKGLQEESGGILNDSLFESLRGSRKVVSPRLNEAQTRFKNRSAYIKQYWNFGSAKYTYKNDDTLYDFESNSHIAYTLHAQETSYIFENNGNTDSTLFPNQFFDVGNQTMDSAYYGNLSNKLAYNWFTNKQTQAKDSIRNYIGATLQHQLIVVAQNTFVRNYHNLIAELSMEHNALKNYSLSYSGYGAFTISGFNSGDAKLTGSVRYRLPKFDIEGNTLIQTFRPDYSFLKFKANQFIWENSFDKTAVTKLGGSISTRNWKHNATISIQNFALQNWAYAGTDGTPKQNTGTFIVQTITLSKTFNVWKFYFEHELMAQKSFSQVIRVPDFGGMARYYFASKFVKKMKFQLGVAIFYNTAYFGNAYNPSTRFFHLQNTKQIGNYPVIDPFFVGEVKRVAFFVKYEHVNQDLINTGFYYTPSYPITLRSLRFGLRWRFYD